MSRKYIEYVKSNGESRYFWYDLEKENANYKKDYRFVNMLEGLEMLGNFTNIDGGIYTFDDEAPIKNDTLTIKWHYAENISLDYLLRGNLDFSYFEISFADYCVAKLRAFEPMTEEEKLEIAKIITKAPAWGECNTQDPCSLLGECNYSQEKLHDIYFETLCED